MLSFKTVKVNGISRLSWPVQWDGIAKEWARRFYAPFKGLERVVYALWWRHPISTGRLAIEYADAVPRLGIDYENVKEFFADITGKHDLIPVFYFPPQDERKKSALLLIRTDGEPEAFVKLGWSNTIGEIENEINAIRYVNRLSPTSFGLPALLSEGWWSGFRYSVFVPVRGETITNKRWISAYQQIWIELVEKTCRQVSVEEAMKDVETSFVDFPDWRMLLEKVFSPNSQSTFSAIHGDFALWNIIKSNKGVVLLDWEEFSSFAPYLVDPVHFILSVHSLVYNRGAVRLAQLLTPMVRRYEKREIILALMYLAARSKFPPALLLGVARKIVEK